MVTNDGAASNLGSVAMVKEAPTCDHSWIYILVFLSLNKVIGLCRSSLSKFVFYIFWEIFLLLLGFFGFFLFVFFFCRFMCVILWSAKKGTVNLEETYQRSNFVLWDGLKEPRNCLQNINVFMISWAVEVNQVGTIMAKEGEDINSAVLIRTTK